MLSIEQLFVSCEFRLIFEGVVDAATNFCHGCDKMDGSALAKGITKLFEAHERV